MISCPYFAAFLQKVCSQGVVREVMLRERYIAGSERILSIVWTIAVGRFASTPTSQHDATKRCMNPEYHMAAQADSQIRTILADILHGIDNTVSPLLVNPSNPYVLSPRRQLRLRRP